jgi:hypothetical protein
MVDVEAPRDLEGLTPLRRVSGALVAIGLVALGACDDGSRGARKPVASCTNPPEIAFPSDAPSDFPWLRDIPVMKAQVKKKFVIVEGFSERSVDELFEEFQPLVTDNGFDILNTDFEGFEAEVYFAKSRSLAGIVALREGPCDGFVKVNVIYDPLETAAGREAVRKTRQLSGKR